MKRNENDEVVDWQPRLLGNTLELLALQESDFNGLFLAASDPKIWELHPVKDRYTKPKFEIYFRTGIESKGALVVRNKLTKEVIGSSRFARYSPQEKSVEIGYTFLKVSHWGTGANKELKYLMLNYAFRFVNSVEFYIGAENWRSQAAIKKIGGKQVNIVTEVEPEGDLRKSFVYAIYKSDFEASASSFAVS